MALTRRMGLGVTLAMDPAGASNYVTLGAIVDGFSGSAKADVADMSILSDTFKPKGKGQVDPGEITLSIAYDPDDNSNTNTSRALAAALALTGPTPRTFQISYPAVGAVNASTENFSGHITGLGREVKKGDMIVAPVTITVSGDPGFKSGA